MEVSSQLCAPATLHLRERPSGTHWIGAWVGPRVKKDAVGKRKILHCMSINISKPVVYMGIKHEELA
jgi:hypothetical protein